MPQFKLNHPDDSEAHALYGWDRTLGFFVTVFSEARRVAEYDNLQRGYRELHGALAVLAENGFFGSDEIEIVKRELAHRLPAEFDEPSQRRCAEVMVHLRRASD